MKLFVFAFIVVSFLASVDAGCYNDTTADSAIAAVTIAAPTLNGTLNGAPIAANCSTTVTFTGDYGNGLPAGAKIIIASCSGLSDTNTVTLLANNRTFSTCPAAGYNFPVTFTSVFTFSFKMATGASMLIVLQPTAKTLPTIPPTLGPTTSPYNGPFPFNPAASTMDLVIGLDIHKTNEQYYPQSSQMIKDIVSYFSYNNKTVRLSFMTFDPFASTGTGKYPLWSHDVSTINDYLANMPFITGDNSKYFTALKSFFFDKIKDTNFAPRSNIQRVFIIFTGTDSISIAANDEDTIKGMIDVNDIKFIFVNMDPAAGAETNPSAYKELRKITGTDSNAQHWFDYVSGQDNSVNLLETLYFDGNKLCNLDNDKYNVNATATSYFLPSENQVPPKFYCNYMINIQTYNRTNVNDTIRVSFKNYDLANEKDFIRIGVDGEEVSVLTGRFGHATYCLNGTTITVTFQSNTGIVYSGYNSTVKADIDLNDCETDARENNYIKTFKNH